MREVRFFVREIEIEIGDWEPQLGNTDLDAKKYVGGCT